MAERLMKQIWKTIVAIAVAAAVVAVVRGCLFSVCTVTTDLQPQLRAGDRVLVDKLHRKPLHRGQLIVFSYGGNVIGRVDALPGDTIRIRGERYLIPQICCDKCRCPDCKLYLVNTGAGTLLVHRHQLVGTAVKIFHLPW
jgi:signal peptidase I